MHYDDENDEYFGGLDDDKLDELRCIALAESVQDAQYWLSLSPLFLDTETTGLDDQAEIVEIGITDAHGNVVFQSLVKPTKEIPEQVEKIHGISNEAVQFAPTWAQIHEQVSSLVNGRFVVIYNAQYDLRLLDQTARAHGLQMPNIDAGCAMLAFAKYLGQWNDARGNWRWHKLVSAAEYCQYAGGGAAHRAVEDCRMAAHVVRAMANQFEPPVSDNDGIPF